MFTSTLSKSRSGKFRKIYRKASVLQQSFFNTQNLPKTPVPEILFSKKGTSAPVFSYELYEIYQNNFFAEHLRATASVLCTNYWVYDLLNPFIETICT